MTEPVIIGNATLYHGDCLEILPTLGKVDAVITDPPYGIGFKYESHDDDPEKYEDMMLSHIAQVNNMECKSNVYWQGMKYADRWHKWFPPGYRMFAACKGFVQYRPTPIQWSWDPVIFWGDIGVDPSVEKKDWHIQLLAPFGCGREKINHPCPRPYEQVLYIVGIFTRQEYSVIDPFMGSGTTGVACMNLGRRFIGIEIEKKYFDIACERIEQAQKQQRLFE